MWRHLQKRGTSRFSRADTQTVPAQRSTHPTTTARTPSSMSSCRGPFGGAPEVDTGRLGRTPPCRLTGTYRQSGTNALPKRRRCGSRDGLKSSVLNQDDRTVGRRTFCHQSSNQRPKAISVEPFPEIKLPDVTYRLEYRVNQDRSNEKNLGSPEGAAAHFLATTTEWSKQWWITE